MSFMTRWMDKQEEKVIGLGTVLHKIDLARSLSVALHKQLLHSDSIPEALRLDLADQALFITDKLEEIFQVAIVSHQNAMMSGPGVTFGRGIF